MNKNENNSNTPCSPDTLVINVSELVKAAEDLNAAEATIKTEWITSNGWKVTLTVKRK